MTHKQLAFVDEYLVDLNAAAAARRAGFAANSSRITACRLLTNANIQALITKQRDESAQRLKIRREDILKNLLEAYDHAREKGSPHAMIAACTEINKMLGFHAD